MFARVRSAAFSGRMLMISARPEIILYLGRSGDYVIVDGVYCSCEAFQRGLARGDPGCKHVYAVRLAKEHGRIRVLELPPSTVSRIIWEAMTGGRSRTARLRAYRLEEDVGEHDD